MASELPAIRSDRCAFFGAMTATEYRDCESFSITLDRIIVREYLHIPQFHKHLLAGFGLQFLEEFLA
jgi:hypothetical protein